MFKPTLLAVMLGFGRPAHGQPTPGAAAAPAFATLAMLRGNRSVEFAELRIAGYHARGDRGAGAFIRDSTDTTSADNGGTLIVDAAGQRWKRVNPGGWLTPQMFGARCDNASDDTARLQAMFNAANRDDGNEIHFIEGQCVVSGAVFIDHPVKVQGPGAQALDTGMPYAGVVVAFSAGDVFVIRHSRANTFRDLSIRTGVPRRTDGADFHVVGDGRTEPVGNVWDAVVTNGSCTVIAMDGGKHWKVSNSLFQYGHADHCIGIDAQNAAFPDSGDNAVANTQFISATSGAGRGYAAVYFESALGTAFIGNKFFGGLFGIVANLKAGTGNLQITANSFEQQAAAHIDVRQGAAGGGGGNITINGNEFSNLDAVSGGGVNPAAAGISINQGSFSTYLVNIAINGNVFNSKYQVPRSEIMIDDGHAVTITGNAFNFYGYANPAAIQSGGHAAAVTIGMNAFTGMNTAQHYKLGLNSETVVIGDTLHRADLGDWADGSQVYCADCSANSAAPAVGKGGFARRSSGAWLIQ